MEYKFSNRVQNLKPSAIREIFKYASDPQVVSLSAGNPSPEAFPINEIREISKKIFEENPIGALQYSISEGYPNLRETLRDYMKKNHSAVTDEDDILITTGAQQIMDLATKALVNEGDVIITESPSFIGSLNTFRSYNAKLVGVPMDMDGMNLDALENALRTNPNTKFIYTIPNFQNPSGITMSLEKRKAVYNLALKYGVLIREDNPYGDLRYSGEYIPCIKSFDTEGIVIYAGSMSKVISPGIRVAYTVAPKPIFQKMVVCKQGNDVHTNVWSQMVCNEFMTKYDYEGHLEKLRSIYSKKAQYMMELLDEYLVPLGITYAPITGGLFTMCTLPDYIDMPNFCKQAVLNKVCVVPGNAFLTDENEECHTFRVNFSTPTDQQLKKGIMLLAETAKKYIK